MPEESITGNNWNYKSFKLKIRKGDSSFYSEYELSMHQMAKEEKIILN